MSQIPPVNAAINLFGDDEEQPIREQRADDLIAQNRAATPQSALDKRATPRLSIREMNSMDMDQIKAKFAKIRRDDRTPTEQVLDLVDLPRNTVLNIAAGTPSATGIASLIGGSAAVGAGVGAFGGPAGAAAGALVGGGLGLAGGLVGLAGRALLGEETRADIADNGNRDAAAGQKQITTSDALRSLGVKNRVVSGIAGFVGDVALDPLTYVGGAGWSTALKGEKVGKSLVLRGSESRSLKKAIAAAAAGTQPTGAWGEYLARKGLVKAVDESPTDALSRISGQVYGRGSTGVGGITERIFRPLGGGQTKYGSGLVEDFFDPTNSPASEAARLAVGQSTPGAGALRVGVKSDDVGREVLHVPFSGLLGRELSVQIPAGKTMNRQNFAYAREGVKNSGVVEGIFRNAVSGPVASAALRVGEIAAESSDLASRTVENRAMLDELGRRISEGYQQERGGFPYRTTPTDGVAGERAGQMFRMVEDINEKTGEATQRLVKDDLYMNTFPSTDRFGRPLFNNEFDLNDMRPVQNMVFDSPFNVETQPWPAQPFNPDPITQQKNAIEREEFLANKQQDELLAEAQMQVDVARQMASATDPIEAAKSMTGIADVIAQKDAIDLAQRHLDFAATNLARWNSIKEMGDLRLMSKEHAVEQIGEDAYNLSTQFPEMVDRQIELNQKRFEAAQLLVESTQAPLRAILDDADHPMVDWAMRLVGTDDEGVGISLFGKMGHALRDNYGGDNAVVRTLESSDRFWRKTFGVRRGDQRRKVVDIHRQSVDGKTIGLIAREELEKSAKAALQNAGMDVSKKTMPDVMQYINLRAKQMVDDAAAAAGEAYAKANPNQPPPRKSAFYTWEFSPEGPKFVDGKLANKSQMVQRLEQMRSTVFNKPGVAEALDGEAAKLIGIYEQARGAAMRNQMLRYGVEGYTGPNKLSEAFGESVNAQVENYRNGATKGFIEGRTTDQIRFQDPATGQWHKFHMFDAHLVEDFPDAIRVEPKSLGTFDLAGNPIDVQGPPPKGPVTPEELMAEKYGHSKDLLAAKIEARNAVKRYRELVADDPEFAFIPDHLPHQTDPVELNQIASTGYFGALNGSKGGIDNFFDMDAGAILEQYMGSYQRLEANRKFVKLLSDNGVQVDGKKLVEMGKSKGTINAGGVEISLTGQGKSLYGTEVAEAMIGNQRYRQLDPSLRGKNENLMFDVEAKDIEGLLVHEHLADAIESINRVYDDPKKIQNLLETSDRITSLWKTQTLFHPSWPIFNVVGGLLLALQGGARADHVGDPRRIKDAINLSFNTPSVKDIMVTAGGVRYSGQEFRKIMQELGIIFNGPSTEAISSFIAHEPGILGRGEKYLRTYLAPWFRANQHADDTMRILSFKSHLDQGATMLGARDAVLRSMFDFQDFTAIERHMFRRLMPFYSWMRSNAGYQLHTLMQNPMYATLAPKFKQALEDTVTGESATPENMRPAWMRDALAAQLGSDPKSSIGVMLGNGVLPQTEVANFLLPLVGAEGVQKFFHYFTSAVNPTLTAPLQYGTGIEFFSGRTIAPDLMGDLTPGEFASNLVRPLAEYGPGGKVQRAYQIGGTGAAVARALVGGRVQNMDLERIQTSREREFHEEEVRLRSAVRKAERLEDKASSQEARARLFRLYQQMKSLGFDIPNWAEAQLAEVSGA